MEMQNTRLYQLPAAAVLEVMISRIRAYEGGSAQDAIDELEHALEVVREDQANSLLEDCQRGQAAAPEEGLTNQQVTIGFNVAVLVAFLSASAAAFINSGWPGLLTVSAIAGGLFAALFVAIGAIKYGDRKP